VYKIECENYIDERNVESLLKIIDAYEALLIADPKEIGIWLALKFKIRQRKVRSLVRLFAVLLSEMELIWPNQDRISLKYRK
jgi:hypothetical protein